MRRPAIEMAKIVFFETKKHIFGTNVELLSKEYTFF